MSDNTMVYVAKEGCGCNVVVIVDNPKHKRSIAKEIASCIRDGLEVNRMPLDAFRQMPFGHKCKERQATKCPTP